MSTASFHSSILASRALAKPIASNSSRAASVVVTPAGS